MVGRRAWLVSLAAAVAAALMLGLSGDPASSAPGERPDASCQGTWNLVTLIGSAAPSQTFAAQATGRLTGVVVPIADNNDVGSLVAEVRAVDGSGAPTSTVLASSSVPASQVPDTFTEVRFAFDPGAQVVAGQQYAIVLRATDNGLFRWQGSSTDPCPGMLYFSQDGGQTFALGEQDSDVFFAAFVTPPERDPGPRPGPNPGPERCTIEGTRGSDTLVGTARDDVICGFGGGDILIGKGGDDVLRGGPGGDSLDAVDDRRGNDTADGGRGRDACTTDRRDERISC